MASDTPNATWHPAMMPNSHPEVVVPPHIQKGDEEEEQEVQEQEQQQEVEESQPPQLSESESVLEHADSPATQDAPNPEIPNNAAATEAANTDSGGYLDQFTEDDSEVGSSDLENHDVSVSTAVQEGHNVDPEAGAARGPQASAPEEVAAQTKAAKHSSTVSFARTVPHEMQWNDDDDVEFNLERTETDPFKFMPPNERTNSFPEVPRVESSADDFEPLQAPPPTSEAQEIMQEIEIEEQQDEFSHQPNFMKSFDDASMQDQQPSALFPVGGDLLGTEGAASGARFEEGLPLIPHSEPERRGAFGEPDSSGLEASHDEEAGGEDFFSQIQGEDKQEVEEFDLTPVLQRKDTSVFTTISHETNGFEPESPLIHEADESQAGFPFNASEENTADDVSPVADASEETQATAPAELDAKWAAAFGEDDTDDFLLEDSTEEKVLDPTAFFGSDDEGFLEDEDEAEDLPTAASQIVAAPGYSHSSQASANGRYTPAVSSNQTQPLLNTFNSTPEIPQVQQAFPPQYTSLGATPYGAPPLRPEVSKAQSFVDKSKGGYASPYDLPMDVVRAPRLAPRTSMQQLPRAIAPAAPPTGPARSASMYTQAPSAPVAIPSPPSSSGSNQPPTGLKPAPKLTPKSNFFEDLPVASKPRPASRQNSLPPQQPPFGQAQPLAQGPHQGSPMAPPSAQQPSGVAGLVAPERVSPYVQSQTFQSRTAPPASNRYSPAPTQGTVTNGMAPPTVPTSRYSPAPSSRSNSGQYPIVPPPNIAHQPRTSSPLAQFVSQDASQRGVQVPSLVRSASSQYEPRLARVSSLPPTREVEEDGPSQLLQSPPPMLVAPRYSPQQVRRTPPPAASPTASTLSPPKRSTSNYAPVSQSALPTKGVNFAHPPRSQTQSPGALHGRAPAKSTDAAGRPSSAHGPTSPRQVSSMHSMQPTVTRARGMSQVLNLVPPTDGRELDPLQRWRGAPSISWGFGGSIVSSFPKDIPRYGMNQALPQILRSPGEVKIQHIKDVQPIEERLAKFPGPLKGKSKKKEAVAWLSQGIETLEKALPNNSFQQHVGHEDKRAEERILLWKILRVLIENDGALEGNPNVEQAVRQVLSPELDASSSVSEMNPLTTNDLHGAASGTSGLQTDAVDLSTVEQIRKHLLIGDREKAAWAAVDRRLWGHAMLISSTVPGDLYKQVTQEFVKKEVSQSGGSNEPLATLYGVLSGNHEESVDALVPSHARAGMQLISTSTTSGQSSDALAGLDKWRETLGLVLSNRSNNDVVAITSLGSLLSSYGRAEAAHICFLFARKHAVFGGLDDPNANFVLVGADHRRQADSFAKETEAVLLSEVYEYGLALSGSNTQQSCPHLAAYKLQHALTLAEYGSRDKALAYCEAIASAITAQTKRSPYYHPILNSAVDDLMGRLKLAPKDGGSSWISKPSSSSMWDKFNKFVSGDDAQASGQASPGEPGAEAGPFARIAGGTPTISRSPSVNNFETFGGPSPGSATRASSRYAPANGQPVASYDPNSTYAARTSMERSSGEYQRGSLELPRPAQESFAPMYSGPSVETTSTATFGYQPVSTAASQSQYNSIPGAITSASPSRSASSYSPYQPTKVDEPRRNSYSPYESVAPQQTSYAPNSMPTQHLLPPVNVQSQDSKVEIAINDVPATVASNMGYQAPSYGYEPPAISGFVSAVDASDAPDESAQGTIEAAAEEAESAGGWSAPSFQPYSYEPLTSYEPDAEGGEPDTDQPKPKKKNFMDDDDDGYQPMDPAVSTPGASSGQSKSDKDRENQEMFRKVAEEEAKRAADAKGQKKSGWLGGWFGGAKKEAEMPANKPIRAKLGETSSFHYDPDQKRWVNKKAGAEDTVAKSATPPPPPRAASRNGTPPAPGASSSAPPMGPPMGSGTPPPPAGAPPMGMPRGVSNLSKMASMDNLRPSGPALGGMPPMVRSTSNMSNISNGSVDSNGLPTLAPPAGLGAAPTSRPSTGLSNASSIDDLIGTAGPRTKGKKPRKSGRYIDVMAK